MTTPSVTIILVNWNGLVDTLACLRSLQKLTYPNYEVIVVDNGSADDSVAEIGRQHPEAILIPTGENLGFVGGNNVALEHPTAKFADYALLLNNDTEVSPDFLDILVDVGESSPKVGIVGPLIYYFDQPQTVWSAGGTINFKTGETEMVGIGQTDAGQFGDAPYPANFVTGCALLIKQEVIRNIGLLDSRFFAYYEETEWCVRATQAGYQIRVAPRSKIWHKITVVAREASPWVQYYMSRNRLLFLNATQAGWSAWYHTLLKDYARTLLSWSVRPKWRSEKAPQRRAMFQAINDYYRGRFGRVDLR